jgi:hypothetical protein
MRRSEIFESFVKIAQEKGLISDAEHAEHTEKDFSETNPRMDSLTIEQISKLYNTKPEQPADMKYKNNIMEDAHPDPIVISPSYDALNGLVESEIEGQNIRMRIVMKEPDGHLVNRKYAEKQLVLSLVRTAEQLDNLEQDELRKLADVCLIQASGSSFKKVAWIPVAIAIAAAIGVLYAKQHLRFHSDGFEADYSKATAEIDDLLNSAQSTQTTLGAGYEYTPAFLQMVAQLKTQLSKLQGAVQKIVPVLEKIEIPRTGMELKDLSAQPATQEAATALEDFKKTVEEVYPFINRVITNFANEGFKQRAIAQKGILSSMVDATEILHGGAGLIADDFDDVKHALQTLKVDIDNIVKGLQASEGAQQSATQQLQETQAEETKLFQHQTPAAGGGEVSPTEVATEEAASPFAALEKGFEGLSGGL